jgi:uncharacterized protein (TIGR03085 family)
MQHHVLDERQEFGATLRACGPDGPTLCGEWTTSELVAHLILRERLSAEAAGRVPVRQLRELSENVIAGYVAGHDYPEMVDAFEGGPPAVSPWAIPMVREAFNLLEYTIHHEDVRRGAGDTTPRELPAAREHAIWNRLRRSAPFTMRMVPVRVRLEWPGHGSVDAGRRGHGKVVITGDPLELALVSFGRQRVAHVAYHGSAEDVAVVSGARIAV